MNISEMTKLFNAYFTVKNIKIFCIIELEEKINWEIFSKSSIIKAKRKSSVQTLLNAKKTITEIKLQKSTLRALIILEGELSSYKN